MAKKNAKFTKANGKRLRKACAALIRSIRTSGFPLDNLDRRIVHVAQIRAGFRVAR